MSQNEEVVMALNPQTNKLINVKPLFVYDVETGFDEAYEVLDEAIKTIVTRCDFEIYGIFIKEQLYGLFKIRDLFKELSDCKISMPEKKGGCK